MNRLLKYVSAALLFTVWPQIAAAQTTFNFPLAVGGTLAGFAIVNPNATEATATFRLYSFEGQTLATATRPVPARGQLSILDSEIFPIITHAGELGWIQIESAEGTQAFIIQGDFLTQVDGASPPTPSLQQVVPLIAGQMKVYGVNPGTARIVVQIQLYDVNGTEVRVPVIGTITLEIPPKGLLAQTFDLNSGLGALVSSAVYARVTSISGGPFVGGAIVGGFLVAPGRDFAVISGVDTTVQTTELNFPHAISGDLGSSTYSTSLGVVNLSSQSQVVTVSFTPQSGTALSIQRTLSGGAAFRQTIQELFNLSSGYQDGWVQVKGTAALTGFVGFADTKAGGLAVSAPQPTGATALIFDHIADLNPWWTGIALVNPGNTDANIEVFAMNPNGTLIGGADNVATARFVLPAKRKTAKLLGELIPATQARASDGGFVLVRVTNGVPVFGAELFFLRNGSAFANVAPVALPPNVNYSPPQP
jgi:hypothetical protein